MGGLERSNDPESYAGGSVATGRVSQSLWPRLRETPTESGRYNPNISNGGNAIVYRNTSEAGLEAIVGLPTPNSGTISNPVSLKSSD